MFKSNKTKLAFLLALAFAIQTLTPASRAQTLPELTTTMETKAALDGAQVDNLRDKRPQRSTRDRRTKNRGSQQSNEAADAGKNIDSHLADILDIVNQAQKPAAQQIILARQSLDKNKRYLKQFKEQMLCQYYMLAAWLEYFDGDPVKALQAAVKAQKTDAKNNDAEITQVAIAILAGKKPIEIKPQSKKRTAKQNDTLSRRNNRQGSRNTNRRNNNTNRRDNNRNRRDNNTNHRDNNRNRNENTRGRDRRTSEVRMPPGRFPGQFAKMASVGSTQASSGNILDFDVDAVNPNLLGERIGPLQLNCLNGTSFTYKPAQANLCLLLWQTTDTLPEPNVPGETRLAPRPKKISRAKNTRAYPEQFMLKQGMGMPGFRGKRAPGRNKQDSDPFSSQMSAYAELFTSQVSQGQIKFVAVNTNTIFNKQAVIQKIAENSWPWAQAMTEDSKDAAQFASIPVDPQKPTLIIAAKNGTIQYAGPAAGFLPSMVINKRLDIASEDETVKITNNQPQNNISQTMQKMFQSMTTNTQNNTPKPTPNEPQDQWNPQAENLLNTAKQYYKIGTRFTTPKKFVDMCRQILRDYPDTHYAEEARQLLRKLPGRHRKRYNVTNQEMGL